MNQYKERITRLRDIYSGDAIGAGIPLHYEPGAEYYGTCELDYEAHTSACAHIVADAYRNGDYAHMWEALVETLDERDDAHDELTQDILAEAISELGWNTQPINPDAFNNDAFTGIVLDSLVLTPAGYMRMALSRVIEALGEGDDAEYANSLTITERTAHIILDRKLHIEEYHMQRIKQGIPFLHHQSIADHIMRAPGEQETSLARLGGKILRYEAISGKAISDDVIFFVNSDTDSVCEAARWWRDAIALAEEHGDSEAETVARRAHAYLCLALLNRRSLPHAELAALIETMQTPVTGVETLTIVTDASVWRKPITTVEQLIDYAAKRMSAAL